MLNSGSIQKPVKQHGWMTSSTAVDLSAGASIVSPVIMSTWMPSICSGTRLHFLRFSADVMFPQYVWRDIQSWVWQVTLKFYAGLRPNGQEGGCFFCLVNCADTESQQLAAFKRGVQLLKATDSVFKETAEHDAWWASGEADAVWQKVKGSDWGFIRVPE